jgi:Tfp pilus assembly protein PilF
VPIGTFTSTTSTSIGTTQGKLLICSYRENGDRDKAIAGFTKSIRRNPDSALAHYTRGLTYETKGETSKAEADFAEATRLEH